MAANMSWAVHNGGQYSGSDEEEDVSIHKCLQVLWWHCDALHYADIRVPARCSTWDPKLDGALGAWAAAGLTSQNLRWVAVVLYPVHVDYSPSCNVMAICSQLVSLQRYRKAYKLPDYPTTSRDDLVQAIIRHFANVVSAALTVGWGRELLSCERTVFLGLESCHLIQSFIPAFWLHCNRRCSGCFSVGKLLSHTPNPTRCCYTCCPTRCCHTCCVGSLAAQQVLLSWMPIANTVRLGSGSEPACLVLMLFAASAVTPAVC